MINLKQVSACLITKDPLYPPEILQHIQGMGFGEILILCNSDSPYRKHELFQKAIHSTIYYQDDDAICPIGQLASVSDPNLINVAMKPGHFEAYKDNRATMGLGWGSFFPKSLLRSLYSYILFFGEDEVYRRETERIFTYLNYPQNRVVLPIEDLPSATDGTRLWQQPHHNQFKQIAEERCREILAKSV